MAMTPEEAAAFLRDAAGRVKEEMLGVAQAVTSGAKVLAVGFIGHQQPEWDPLSTATIFGFRHARGFWIEGKAALGFEGPDYEPLLRSGEMRDSYQTAIEEEPGGVIGAVGSNDKTALYQEVGTPNARYPIPARPVLALAMQTMVPEAQGLCEEALERLLTPP